MPVKKTSKNQMTSPKKALEEISATSPIDSVLILRPVTVAEPGSRLAAVRRKITPLGIQAKDLNQAIAWAPAHRKPRRRHTPSV